MAAFVLTLIYITISLMSPDSLPEALQGIHLLQIIAALVILSSIPDWAKSRIIYLKETYFITGLLFAAFISVLMTGWVGGALSVFTGFLPIVAAYFFVVITCTTLTRMKILALVLFAALTSILAHGMLAAQSGDLISPYFIREATVIRLRGLGVIADPNDLAQVLIAAVPLLWLRWKKGALAANMGLTLMPAAFLCYGVYLTHSRGGLVALIITVLYGFKHRLGLVRSLLLTGMLCAALIAFNATGGRNINDDDGDRIGLWSSALSTFKAHPLTGVGMDNFGDYSGTPGLTAHNSYVLCLAELGLLGYTCWMGAIVTSWSGLTAIAARRPNPGAELAASPLGPVATVVNESISLKMRQTVVAARAQTPDAPRISPSVALRTPHPALLPGRFGEDAAEKTNFQPESHILRSALVGVLVSAFFISRTYAVILYIVFGMSAALQVMAFKANGPEHSERPVAMRIAFATFTSVLFIYLFVRFRGSH